MLKQKKMTSELVKQRLGLATFTIGFILGMSVVILMIWGDLEASLFDVTFRAEQSLRSISCPVAITADEQATISATFYNDKDREENVFARAHISSGFVTLIREEETRFALPPNGSKRLEWNISADDAAWDRIILARIGAVQRVPYPQLVGGACGVLLIPISGITGTQLITLTLIISYAAILGGGWLWGLGRRPLHFKEQKLRNYLFVYTGLLTGSLIMGFLNQWLFGLFAIIIILLLISSTLEQLAFAWRR